MFLNQKHTRLDVYKVAKSIVRLSHTLTLKFPSYEMYGLSNQIRRASISIAMNIAEGASRISPKERARYYEMARGSVNELDTAFELSVELNYLQSHDLSDVGDLLVRAFKMLSRMMRTQSTGTKSSPAPES